MTDLASDLAGELEELAERGRRRELPERSGGVDFSSNDFLGLSRHPRVVEAATRALAEHGAGGRASRLLAGGAEVHEELEREAAAWLGAERALFFPSGYQANLGLLGALAGRGDALFSDRLNHASLIDGARLSRARVVPYDHADPAALARALDSAGPSRRRLVVTESIFSMDGDLAPLAELDAVCARHDAWLVVDEAHAAGLLGPAGAGAVAALEEPPGRLLARVVTAGKALGAAGALVAGSAPLVATLVNRARAFLFTTAAPPATAAAALEAIRLLREGLDTSRPCELARRVARCLGLPAPCAAIVPFPIGDDAHAVELATELAGHGLDVRAVRPPTVPEGSARLRIVCHAANTDAEVEELVRRLEPRRADATPAEAARELAPRLFVTGTDTGVGKTVVSALLTRAAARRGGARYWKPVQTGDDSDTDEVARLAALDPKRRLPPAFEFPLPASPHEAAAAVGREIPTGAVEASLAGIRRMLAGEQLVVELAGGLLVPLRDDHTQLDWLAREAPPLVLVARSGLGTLNHTLLSLEALRARHLEPRALFLVGERHDSNRETLRRLGRVPAIFEVPPIEPLDAGGIDAWLDANALDELFG